MTGPNARAPRLKVGQVISDRYEVLAALGDGVLGSVYKVKDRREGEVVALKVIHPALVSEEADKGRLIREFKTARKLRHPGVARYIDGGEIGTLTFLTMEYVEGQSLRDWIDQVKRERDFTPEEIYGIGVQLLETLRYTHQVTLHRNLKPSNIIVYDEKRSDGRVRKRLKVTDTGIANVLSPTLFAQSYVNRSDVIYAAPEASEYQHRAGPTLDIYSVGAILYELLTGAPPQGQYQLPSEVRKDVNKSMDNLIEIALAPNPQDRFQSTEDFLGVLKETFANLYGGGSSKQTVWALMALLVICGLAAVYVNTKEQPSVEELRSAEILRRDGLRNDLQAAQSAEMPSEQREGMVYVPAGPFLRGGYIAFDDRDPSDPIEERAETDGFWIDVEEYPNTAGEPPLTGATWSEAQEYCASAGKMLCSDLEWEKACRGPRNLIYPYADHYEADACPGYSGGYQLGDFAGCTSGYGVRGMGGGVAEWTSTAHEGEGNALRVWTKGGLGPGKEAQSARCASRLDERAVYYSATIGFRCCAPD